MSFCDWIEPLSSQHGLLFDLAGKLLLCQKATRDGARQHCHLLANMATISMRRFQSNPAGWRDKTAQESTGDPSQKTVQYRHQAASHGKCMDVYRAPN